MADRDGFKLNGLAVKSWGDIIAVATLLSMLLATVGWGLKLEGELNELRSSYGTRIANLEARVADGILPRAEERIEYHRREIDKLNRRLERLEN